MTVEEAGRDQCHKIKMSTQVCSFQPPKAASHGEESGARLEQLSTSSGLCDTNGFSFRRRDLTPWDIPVLNKNALEVILNFFFIKKKKKGIFLFFFF